MEKSNPLWKIHIERDGNRYHYVMDNPKVSTVSFRGTLDIPSVSRNKVLSTLEDCLSVLGMMRGEPAKTRSSDFKEKAVPPKELGRMIYKYMLPAGFRDELKDIKSEFVRVSTDDVEVPWELLHDGDRFFSLKNAVGRTVETKEVVGKQERPDLSQTKVLLIGNPTCDLEGAEKEVKALEKRLSSIRGVELDVMKGGEATIENLQFDHLEKNFYDIIHYAGHTDFRKARPEESEIRLNNGELTAQYLLSFLDPPPRLILMNSCSSSTSSEIEYWEREGKVTGLANAFLSSGVDHYIGTLWPVRDKVSCDISERFYRRLFEGYPIGEALRTAKEFTIEEHGESLSSSSFILYGDPTTVYVQPDQKKTKEKYSTRDFFYKMHRVRVDILNAKGDAEVKYTIHLKNISDHPITSFLKELHTSYPVSREEFNLSAESEGKELETKFIENLPHFKRFSIQFGEAIKPGNTKKFSWSYIAREFETEKNEEYWPIKAEEPKEREILEILLPPEMDFQSCKLLDDSLEECEKGTTKTEKSDGRTSIICEMEDLPKNKIYKLIWNWK